MFKYLIITVTILFAIPTAKGQSVFIIGERSYPSTNAVPFSSNAADGYDLDVYIAKEGEFGYIAVSRKSSEQGEKFAGNFIIYLDNGSVITCYDSELSEKVGDRANALYPLTADQLNKLKNSSIVSVKYAMIHDDENIFSATNTGVTTNELINELFEPKVFSRSSDPLDGSLKDANDVEVSEAEPLAYTEQMPSYPDGTEAMYRYVYSELEYPAVAKAKGIMGQVIVQFVVSTDGKIENAKITRGIGGGCDEEALRVVNSMPTWNPGIHNGRAVPVTFTLPIKFVY